MLFNLSELRIADVVIKRAKSGHVWQDKRHLYSLMISARTLPKRVDSAAPHRRIVRGGSLYGGPDPHPGSLYGFGCASENCPRQEIPCN
jgi:hypothetical protein